MQNTKSEVMDPLNDRLLTRKEAAVYLGVTVACLAAWATYKRQPLPYIKLGNMVRYRLQDLENLVKKQLVTISISSN